MDERIKQSAEGIPSFEIVGSLPEELGFVESEELTAIRAGLLDAMRTRSWDAISELSLRYEKLGKELANQHKDEESQDKAHIGRKISMGLIWGEVGKLDSYVAELENARQYANNVDFADIVKTLDKAVWGIAITAQEWGASEHIQLLTEDIIKAAKNGLPPELHNELDGMLDLEPDLVWERIANLIVEKVDRYKDPYEFFNEVGLAASPSSPQWKNPKPA